jgi:hypothetical protein
MCRFVAGSAFRYVQNRAFVSSKSRAHNLPGTLQFSFCKICFEGWSKAGIPLTLVRQS